MVNCLGVACLIITHEAFYCRYILYTVNTILYTGNTIFFIYLEIIFADLIFADSYL